jgi:hypothetical protein
MYPNNQRLYTEILLKEIQELEDTYAEALADEADAPTLSVLWNKIKILNRQLEQKESFHRTNNITA